MLKVKLYINCLFTLTSCKYINKYETNNYLFEKTLLFCQFVKQKPDFMSKNTFSHLKRPKYGLFTCLYVCLENGDSFNDYTFFNTKWLKYCFPGVLFSCIHSTKPCFLSQSCIKSVSTHRLYRCCKELFRSIGRISPPINRRRMLNLK